MSFATLAPFVIGVGILLVLMLGVAGLFKAFYRKVDQGVALIVNDMSATPKVHFTGALIIPVLYRAEQMQISLITLQVDRRGKEGLICKDNMRADIAVAFYLRVNETQADVLRVAKAIGADRASDKDAVDELFNAKFSEALKTVGKKFDFTELFEKRQEFRDEIVSVIGNDLNGYALEDVAIDYLEQTPKSVLDPYNILDAEGIRKITQLTAAQNVVTNELEQNAKLAITKKNVEAREALLALERQQAEAEARQKREVETIRAREEAETLKVQEEQRQLAENARIEAQELIDIREQNRLREVEVAEQNRQRAVAIEAERVARAKALEQVTTDREVQLQGVERDKVVENGKMDVANITRERIAIDKTVAQEEERIKEVREVSEADRQKQITILDAEAKAQEAMVRQVKDAQARETSAKHRAVELTTLAQAEFEAAGRQAEAKKVLAEGIRAEKAAPGLADAQVKEASALAIEKVGVAEARVIEAKADASLKQGSNDARVLAETLQAKAQGEEQMGKAKASAAESIGLAEATVVEKKLFAEAQGLTQKFEAIGSLSDTARGHEEFRMMLDTNLTQALASIEAGKEVSKENAEVIATALRNADIDLVGGDGGMFDNLIKAVSLGKSIEGLADKSPIVQDLMQRYLGVNRSEPRARQLTDGSTNGAGLPATGEV
ncbi:Uncharacterized membrane protein YqiK, contains Band7/PHB/SPFH domain [Pseudoxanthomonas sp. GM95]|uniref:flotillin family protein n=1 Tax=Pseudoxanthomonas sp. GM95 TaxID=1881043 RepID=UPI0008D45C4F|nr:hypothetical protein [Pseudoxanthomonas sp. GM95]SEK88702.1 Uncharacterized membrane protein YqiK, contains Band7/PHB/SPFH domain [Pseudoxanthomonas sp. GM95]